ncbi:hypothetical protein [Pseudoalteromonas sp. Z1A8]|uniref:McrB family protein n=1 Tax=Pseudoalteromonas sp. Z1A8 TaxID=2686354 RepID=UPI001F0E3874|nr:hypothetical protein [Pseudoalteromonas sp. Z1A8]
MRYEHWTKIDDGAEGAWAADIWLSALRIISRHEGESIYDADSPIYVELEKEIPELTWRSFEGDSFRPYFRDFSKPWTIPNVASFETTFKVTEIGQELLKGSVSELEFWIKFLSRYQEGTDFPFVELSCAFLKTDKSLTLDEVYWGVVRSFRTENNDQLVFNDLPNEVIPSTAKRRLTLMLQLMERTGAILKIGNGSKQRWKQWDRKTLNKLIKKAINSEIGRSQYSAINKPFLLLAGISGTGKTRFVREQAKTAGQFTETYCLTSVRPDWHEPSDLLGYISRLAKDGKAEYITTDVLQFIAKAWRAIADSGLTVAVQESKDLGKRLVVSGERDVLEQVLPYWLCLDEMNLAPVEQYFSDYLSVLETREWCWTGDSFTYNSDALLKPATIKEVADKEKLREALGFDNSENKNYDELWQLVCQYGLGIPFNLLVAGTVNMDETTHGFSRKVIDRALSFDFGAFFPNDYHDFFTSTSCNKRLSYPIWSNASKADLANTFDADGAKTVAFLSAVNAVLKNTPFELAYRALNELLLAVASSQPQDDLTLKAGWDDFMMCKVLPRIEGDTDKLTTSDGKALLLELSTVLANQLAPIWLASETDEANQRPDLYREKIVADGATDEEKVLRIPCRSKAKLQWMSERLASATFTSFWP